MAFQDATRQNIRSIGGMDYSAGGQTSLTLPKVGYLTRLHLHVTGTMTVTPGTGSATLAEKAPWNILRRVRFEANSGISIFNTSGWGAYLQDVCSKYQKEHEDGQVTSAFGAQVYAAAAASGANAWEFGFAIPIVPNERDIAGIMLLQSEGLLAQLVIEWQTAGGATQDFPVVLTGNATAAFTGRMTVYLESFTVPAMAADQPPIDTMYQTLETVRPIGGTGAVEFELLNANTYVRIIHSVEIADVLNTDAVDSLQFRYNVTETPYDIERKMKLQLQRHQYGRDLPKGVFTWEFFDQGYVNYGGGRDLVDATALAELDSIVNIASGTSLGSGTSRIRTVTQQFVRLGGAGA